MCDSGVSMARTQTQTLIDSQWIGVAFVVGIGLQLVGWIVGIGVFTGLPAYFFVGLVTAWGSPGNTIIEPSIAAFCVAVIGFVLENFLLTVFLVGIPVAITYGVGGVVLALIGAFVGERFLDS